MQMKVWFGCVFWKSCTDPLLFCQVLPLLILCGETRNGGWRLRASASSFLWRLGCAGRSDGSTGVHPSILVLGLLLRRLQDLQHANRAALASTFLQWGDGANHDTIGFLDRPRWTMINVKNYFFKTKNMKKSTFVWTSLWFNTAWSFL